MDYDWWQQITADGAYFVTRLKKDLQWDKVEDREIPQNSNVRKDETIRLRSPRHSSMLLRGWTTPSKRLRYWLASTMANCGWISKKCFTGSNWDSGQAVEMAMTL